MEHIISQIEYIIFIYNFRPREIIYYQSIQEKKWQHGVSIVMSSRVVWVFMPEGGSVALNLYEMCWRTMHQVNSKNTLQPLDNPYTYYIFLC